MPLQYACFISYPHGQDNVLVPFVQDFVAGLEKEIFAQTRKKVWTDFKYLQGGDRFSRKIGPDICKSACMIVIYTPLYFDADHTYCAREYHAMEMLEEKRLNLIGDRGSGLIIPIILRGEKKFPDAIRSLRKFYKFDDIAFNNPAEKIQTRYAAQIKEIAEYILDRCDSLELVTDRLEHNCDEFDLPSEEAAKAYVEKVLGKKVSTVPVPFPGRT